VPRWVDIRGRKEKEKFEANLERLLKQGTYRKQGKLNQVSDIIFCHRIMWHYFLPQLAQYNCQYLWRHDTQHNDTQHKGTQHKGIICDIQHNEIQYKDTQHNNTLPSSWMSLCWGSRLIYCYVKRHYAECCGAIIYSCVKHSCVCQSLQITFIPTDSEKDTSLLLSEVICAHKMFYSTRP
jgi:hypothetical protein